MQNWRFKFVSFRSCRRAFSFVELLVVLAILVILASILLPYLAKVHESDCRVRCADNLRQIMVAFRGYAGLKDSHGSAAHDYPSTIYDPARRLNGYTAFTGADSPNPFAKDTTVEANDVTASLWLLVRYDLVKPGRFICPSTSDSRDPSTEETGPQSAKNRSNFSGASHLSYSYASPFSSAPGYKMNDAVHVADFAVLADKNPGVGGDSNAAGPAYNAPSLQLAKANSTNHNNVGQNVLYADGHVSFQYTPYCGVGQEGKRDNIYTALSPIPLAPGQRPPVESNGVFGRDLSPAWTNDSYLVPAASD